MSILHRTPLPLQKVHIIFNPFKCYVQKRWKQPVNSAQTRLENRTRDHVLDKLLSRMKRLKFILGLHQLILQRRATHTSLQLLSQWKHDVGLSSEKIGSFINKHPHIFEVYTHPVKRNLCCRISHQMLSLIADEALAIRSSEMVNVELLKKLLMMSNSGRLHAHALWLVRAEFGLPDDFRESIITTHPESFRLVDPDTIELVNSDVISPIAEIEKWREREYREKWLSESETKYAFPIQFPTGFKIVKGFREKLKNWQRVPYFKPYEKMDALQIHTRGGIERFEKHAVGVLHEFLSLTVEKMVELERLSHFRRDFSMTVNVRELLLKHPGIFYISARGNSPVVVLRERYACGCLLEPNPVYAIRRKMLDLVLLQCRFAHKNQPLNV